MDKVHLKVVLFFVHGIQTMINKNCAVSYTVFMIWEVTIQIGDIVKFGNYEWRVLDVNNNAALVITEDIVELRAYHNKPGGVTWAGCELKNT